MSNRFSKIIPREQQHRRYSQQPVNAARYVAPMGFELDLRPRYLTVGPVDLSPVGSPHLDVAGYASSPHVQMLLRRRT